MAEFIHSILEPNALVAADGDEVIDLPVNPLSLVLIHISPLNETATIGNYRLLEALLGAIANVEIAHRGSSVINASGVDLAAMAVLYHRAQIWQSNAVETNNDRRSIVLPIFLSKRAFMLDECFPATRRGELQLTVTWNIAETGFDGLRRSIETIELPEATPTNVQKVTTLSTTFGATGQQDVDIPIGNFLRGLLLFGTTGFAGATPVPSWGEVEFFVNNRQRAFTGTDFEVLRTLAGLGGVPFPPAGRHIHSGTYVTTVAGDSREPEIGAELTDNYALMDLDPTRDDEFGVETDGASRVHVRATAETADAVRVLPIERVPVDRFLT